MDIKGKVVIVTGASQGIGLACARKLGSLGARVVLAARSKDAIEKLEKEIPGSLAVHNDMLRYSDIKNMVHRTVEKFGRVDIIVNNAGQGMAGTVEETNIENLRQIMELNLYSVIRAMQEVIPVMRKQGGGLIVNVSSQVTKTNIPSLSAYSSTKYALNSISATARIELEKDNISVCLLMPKLTATNFIKNMASDRKFDFDGRPMPAGDSAEMVADKLVELIRTEEPEALV